MTSEDLTKPIYCDRCPTSRAAYLIKLIEGELAFCNHHYRKYKEALDKKAYEIIELNKIEESPQLFETERI